MEANPITSACQVKLAFNPAIWADLDEALISGTAVSVAIPTVLTRQLDHICDQAFFVSTAFWQSTLRGSVLAQNTANATLRSLHLAANQIDTGAPLGRFLGNRLPGNGRREGFRSFPVRPLTGSICPTSGPRPRDASARSLSAAASTL